MVVPAQMDDAIEKIYLSQDFDAAAVLDYRNHNTDVVVQFVSGRRFIATFFTYQNIETIVQQNETSGDFLAGKYFWANNMLLLDDCSLPSVTAVVRELLEEGEFHQVFKSLNE
ncbi:MAG: hypothetical protein AAFW73_17720 [Bacteroidota bacterium]